MEAAVRRLRPHRAGRHTHLQVDHFKQWQREAYPGEQSKTPPRRERWEYLVDLLQHTWRTGEIPQDLGWTILVLIQNGDHQHKKHQPSGDPVEGSGGADRHLPPREPTDAQCPIRFQERKRNGDGFIGVKARPEARQNIPGSPLPDIP